MDESLTNVSNPTLQLLVGFIVSAGIGFLIGLERQYTKEVQEGEEQFAGIRTFTMVCIAGFASALLSKHFGPWVFAVALAAMSAMLVASYIRISANKDERGGTTEVATLITFLLGGLVFLNYILISLAIMVLVLALLAFKPGLHGFAKKLTRNELLSIILFVVMSALVIPFLPDNSFGPYDLWNLKEIWKMVILVSGTTASPWAWPTRCRTSRPGTGASWGLGQGFALVRRGQARSGRLLGRPLARPHFRWRHAEAAPEQQVEPRHVAESGRHRDSGDGRASACRIAQPLDHPIEPRGDDEIGEARAVVVEQRADVRRTDAVPPGKPVDRQLGVAQVRAHVGLYREPPRSARTAGPRLFRRVARRPEQQRHEVGDMPGVERLLGRGQRALVAKQRRRVPVQQARRRVIHRQRRNRLPGVRQARQDAAVGDREVDEPARPVGMCDVTVFAAHRADVAAADGTRLLLPPVGQASAAAERHPEIEHPAVLARGDEADRRDVHHRQVHPVERAHAELGAERHVGHEVDRPRHVRGIDRL